MSLFLMCKNTKVYNLDTEEACSASLLPGKMAACPCKDTFRAWMKTRYSAGTNTLARMLRGLTFGQGNRAKIDRTTRAFSLTDCYWVTDDPEGERFEDLSPYYQDFWKGTGKYEHGPIPTLYVDGALPKYWKDAKTLVKKEENAALELECTRLCEACGIPVESAACTEDGMEVRNFTSPDAMLEPAASSGRLDPEEFTDADIVRLFGMDGIRMLAIDAITGNGDRHAGNFGWLRDTNTGEYLSMAPLYDFDHALDSACTDHPDVLMDELLAVSKGYEEEITRICDVASGFDQEIFAARAVLLRELLERNTPGEEDVLRE
jgi:hypothetical protein